MPCALAALPAAVPEAVAAALAASVCDCDALCFGRELGPGFALEDAARDPESLPDAVALESPESPAEWAEAPVLFEPLPPCLPPVVEVVDSVRWPEVEPVP